MNVVNNIPTVKNNIKYDAPHYVSASTDGWGIEMVGTDAIDNDPTIDHAGIFGLPMVNLTMEDANIVKARVRNRKGKWLPYSDKFDKSKGLGDGTDITGVEIVGKNIIFAVHLKGGNWLSPIRTSEVEGANMAGSGSAIDAIWIDRI